MSREFLPFNRPSIGQEEIDEVVDTLRSGWITTGPKTKRFEEEFRRYVGAEHAAAVSSCTAGLHLALVALGIGPGDEVITTPLTFCATANVIVHCGATPVLADIDRGSFNIDPVEIKKRITHRTKAIIPVHMAGQPCAMAEIQQTAQEHGLYIIEDAAHAVGARYGEQMIGSLSQATVFSFYATKNLTTAEGGMVTTNDPHIAEKVRLLSLHGISADAWRRYTNEGSWYYEVLYPGYKYNLTDIQASLGLHQLRRLEGFLATRERYAQMYTEALSPMPELITPAVAPGLRHAWHLYILQIRPKALKIDRGQFIEVLRSRGIGTSVHFIPLHLHPYYRDRYGFKRGDFPQAEAVYDGCISLPLYSSLRDEDVAIVIQGVKETVVQNRR